MATGSRSPTAHDDDLAPVLRDIGMGRLASTRAKLANSTETRAFLEIGLDLLRVDLLQHTGPDFDSGSRSALFESVSRERILERAGGGRALSVNMFRYRWDRKDRYTEDLISYMFRLAPHRRHLELMDRTCDELMRTLSLADLVRAVSAVEVDSIVADPLISVQSVIQGALPNHPRVREFCQAQLDQLLPIWAGVYEKVAGNYGLRLRPGLTWLDIAVVFNTIIEGELAWARVGGRPRLSSGDHVLAATILALVPSLWEGAPEDLTTLYRV
ncbi:hypothetical protein ACFPM7_00745 [Actinokineospora guangxiensis]|uniref:Uncharacterized protein n=1 Tax=Actinokineospora guangxiensis TaxID=1490288 RepID=A0ABW0EH55_9PSEU